MSGIACAAPFSDKLLPLAHLFPFRSNFSPFAKGISIIKFRFVLALLFFFFGGGLSNIYCAFFNAGIFCYQNIVAFFLAVILADE